MGRPRILICYRKDDCIGYLFCKKDKNNKEKYSLVLTNRNDNLIGFSVLMETDDAFEALDKYDELMDAMDCEIGSS